MKSRAPGNKYQARVFLPVGQTRTRKTPGEASIGPAKSPIYHSAFSTEAMEMVRDTGFEPVPPSVSVGSRWKVNRRLPEFHLAR